MLKSFPMLLVSLLFYVGMRHTTDLTRPWYDVEAFSVALTSGDLAASVRRSERPLGAGQPR